MKRKVTGRPRIEFDHVKALDLYAMGMSMRKAGAAVGVSAQTICNFIRREKLKIARRPGQLGHYFGKDHHNWKGDNATSYAFHTRVRRLFGDPKKCSTCGTADQSKRYHWANLTGNYEDPLDYKRMCVKCHRAYDIARWRETGKYTSIRTRGKRYRYAR